MYVPCKSHVSGIPCSCAYPYSSSLAFKRNNSLARMARWRAVTPTGMHHGLMTRQTTTADHGIAATDVRYIRRQSVGALRRTVGNEHPYLDTAARRPPCHPLTTWLFRLRRKFRKTMPVGMPRMRMYVPCKWATVRWTGR